MKLSWQNLTLNTIGVFFICFGTFAMDYGIYREKPSWVFYFCYIAMVLIGFGIVLRVPVLIASQLAIVTAPLLVWNIDFFYLFLSHHPLWHVTDYFFTEMLPASRVISFEHFFLLPLGYYALSQIKLQGKKFWILSCVQLLAVYAIVRFGTAPTENVDCVFYSCMSFLRNGSWYGLRWFLVEGFMVTLTAFAINQLPVFHQTQLNKKSV